MDRNYTHLWRYTKNGWSLSARRAWIEIQVPAWLGMPRIVALRKESVDRNGDVEWKIVATYVALRKESVDRNMGVGTTRARRGGRSPQGERG